MKRPGLGKLNRKRICCSFNSWTFPLCHFFLDLISNVDTALFCQRLETFEDVEFGRYPNKLSLQSFIHWPLAKWHVRISLKSNGEDYIESEGRPWLPNPIWLTLGFKGINWGILIGSMRRHQVNSWHIHSIHVRSITDHLLFISNTSIISGACLHYKLLVGVYLHLPRVDVNKINLDSLSKFSLLSKINSVNVGTKPCYRRTFFCFA